MAKFKKKITKNSEKLLIKAFIKEFKHIVLQKKKLNERLSFVLTGGSSPLNLYKQLSKVKINWTLIDLFWGDERFVSKKSNNSNFKLVHKYLIKKIKINKKNIYAINTSKKNINLSTIDYERRIKHYFNNKKITFDLILLGMGLDGHIASIFPNNINPKNNKIVSHVVKKDFKRITLNLKIINKAKNIFLWLNNRNKSNIYKKNINKKKIPVNFLNKKNMKIFSIN